MRTTSCHDFREADWHKVERAEEYIADLENRLTTAKALDKQWAGYHRRMMSSGVERGKALEAALTNSRKCYAKAAKKDRAYNRKMQARVKALEAWLRRIGERTCETCGGRECNECFMLKPADNVSDDKDGA